MKAVRMWISDKLIILHIRKTGGEFIRHILSSGGVNGVQRLGPAGAHWDSHTTINKLISDYNFTLEDIKKRYIAVFVRHPKTRLQSLWGYNRLIIGDFTYDFNEFVELVLTKDKQDLMISDYKKFILDSPVPIDFVGKQENLVDDLITVLENAGETFVKRFILSGHNYKVNDCRNWKDKAIYDPLLLDRLLEIENPVIDEYYT